MPAPDIPWHGEQVSRLVLGTAQLGQQYGVANTIGVPSFDQAKEIVKTCLNLNIRHFDTAQDYCLAELRLGRALRELGTGAAIMSKPPADLLATPEKIEDAVSQSCRLIGVRQLWAVFLYGDDELPPWGNAVDALCRCRDRGQVQYIGVSTGSVRGAFEALNHPEVDMIQLACNAWNQEILRRGVLSYAVRRGKLAFVRGVYLQGLLAMPQKEAVACVPGARQALARWHELIKELGFGSSKQAAMRFALSLEAPLIVGAEATWQIRETARLMSCSPMVKEIAETIDREMSPLVSRNILCPWLW